MQRDAMCRETRYFTRTMSGADISSIITNKHIQSIEEEFSIITQNVQQNNYFRKPYQYALMC